MPLFQCVKIISTCCYRNKGEVEIKCKGSCAQVRGMEHLCAVLSEEYGASVCCVE